MNKLTSLIAVAVVTVTVSQANAQTGPPGGSNVDPPMLRAVADLADDAFYASYDAYFSAVAESSGNQLWQSCANYQLAALYNVYYARGILDNAVATNRLTVEDCRRAKAYAEDAQWAAVYANLYAYAAAGNLTHPAVQDAFDAYYDIELLVDVLGVIVPDM